MGIKNIELVGAGGIGSHLAKQLIIKVARNQFPELRKVTIWDPDTIELKNRLYTIYDCDPTQIGKSKLSILKEELQILLLGCDQKVEFVLNEKKAEPALKNLPTDTVFISAVDGSKFREHLFQQTDAEIIEKFVENNIWWIDLRSKGDRFIVIRNPLKVEGLLEIAPYYQPSDKEGDSCQLASDLAKGMVKIGNELAATFCVAWLLNIERGIPNELRYDRPESSTDY